MVICEQHRTVFVRNPGTASTSIARFLKAHHGGRLLGDPFYGPHRRDVPDEFKSFRIVCMIREPGERFLSLYRRSIVERSPSVRDFASGTAEGTWSLQSTYVRESGATTILRFEKLPRCLLTLPFIKTTKRLRHVRASEAKLDLSAKDVAFLKSRFAEEREALGYT